MLLSSSCFGLRYLVNVCLQFGSDWDIKFNPLKSQLMTFGGDNPAFDINMNCLPIPWVNKVKYLGVCFLSNSGKTDLTDTIRRFYSQFNNIMSVLGKGCHEMNAVHLINPVPHEYRTACSKKSKLTILLYNHLRNTHTHIYIYIYFKFYICSILKKKMRCRSASLCSCW